MKQLLALQQQNRRSNSFRNISSDTTVNESIKSPATIFWVFIHGLCCLISLVLGFRFSRLVFFLLFSPTSSPSTIYSVIQSFSPPLERNMSRVVVGRHGILIRPWPHPDPVEVMRAHKIIERVQMEQRSQIGVKSPRAVIAVTPTYVRTFQALHLTGVMHSLMNLKNDVVWIVVEAGGVTNETRDLIGKFGGRIVHVGFDGRIPLSWEERHKFESKMRLRALRVIREQRLDGIVMFADDSNMHSLELFDEIQNVKWVGAISVGIIAHSGNAEGELKLADEEMEKDEMKGQMPVQGPACNSSNHLVGWHTFDTSPFLERSARFIGDRGVVLPRKLEWAGFVLNSRLVWEDTVEKTVWVKDLDEVGGNGEEDIESPLSLLKDTSQVEPLGRCGRKVMLWWLRVEARVDSKFPARWIIDPPLEITVPAKRTPWPDAPPELPSTIEKLMVNLNQESPEKRQTKSPPRRKRSSRSKKKQRAPKISDEQVSTTAKTF